MLELGQRQHVQADAAELPFDEATFDASCVSFALHEMPASVRERVVREMARVTKPGGSIMIVDYGLPRNRFASTMVFHVVKLYERHHYESFVKSDWRTLLGSAGVEVSDDRPMLGGMARVLIGRTVASMVRGRPESGKAGQVPLAGATALE